MPVLLRFIVILVLVGQAWGAAAESLTCGHLYDSVTGKPIENAVVSSGPRLVRTDANGHFVIAASSEGFQARAPGYRVRSFTADQGHDILMEPFSAKALYLSHYGIAEPILRNPALQMIENTELNALVIDLKGDRGQVAFKVDHPMASEIGAQKILTVKDGKRLLASLKAKDVYTIARIVVFKDDLLAKARPDLAIRTEGGDIWRDGEGMAWVDPFFYEVWEYNISLAEQAARMGFDEIQFDYVRFPDRRGLRFARENQEENRVGAISGFLATARQRLERYPVFLSADIFGYVCWSEKDVEIGQRLEDLSVHLDYISPMLYPSGFGHGVGMYRNPVKHPYEIISLSLNRAQQRTGLPGARFRPWLQAFRDYAFDRRSFGEHEIRAQIEASDDFGSSGWMLWNARNVYSQAGLLKKSYEAYADQVMESAPAHPKL